MAMRAPGKSGQVLDAINTDAQVTRMWQRVSRRTVGQSHFRVGSGRGVAQTEAALLGGGRGWWGKETSTPFPVPGVGFVETRPAPAEKVAQEVYPAEESGQEKARR